MKKVLVVDFDVEFLKSVSLMLREEGFEIITAVDGQAGLERFEADKPDLVILEAMLPKLHGFELCARITENQTHSAPVIVITGVYRDALYKTEALRTFGATSYFEKPVDMSRLLEAIHKAIGASAATARAPEPKKPLAASEKPPVRPTLGAQLQTETQAKPPAAPRPQPPPRVVPSAPPPAPPAKKKDADQVEIDTLLKSALAELGLEPEASKQPAKPSEKTDAKRAPFMASPPSVEPPPRPVAPPPPPKPIQPPPRPAIAPIIPPAAKPVTPPQPKPVPPPQAPPPVQPQVKSVPLPQPKPVAPPQRPAPRPMRPPIMAVSQQQPRPIASPQPKPESPPPPAPQQDRPAIVSPPPPPPPQQAKPAIFAPPPAAPEQAKPPFVPPPPAFPSPPAPTPVPEARPAPPPLRQPTPEKLPDFQRTAEPPAYMPAVPVMDMAEKRAHAPAFAEFIAEPKKKSSPILFLAAALVLAVAALGYFLVIKPKGRETPQVISRVQPPPVVQDPLSAVNTPPPEAKPETKRAAGGQAGAAKPKPTPPPAAAPETSPPPSALQPIIPDEQPKLELQIPVQDTPPSTANPATEQTTPEAPRTVTAPPPSTPSPAGSARAQTGQLVPLEEVESPPRIVTRVDPVYPPIAYRMGMQGTVWINALVSETGNVLQAIFLRGTTAGGLDKAAETAVLKWKYQPAQKDGVNVKVWLPVRVEFVKRD